MHRLTEHDTVSMREVRGLQLGKDRYGYMIHRVWMTGKYYIAHNNIIFTLAKYQLIINFVIHNGCTLLPIRPFQFNLLLLERHLPKIFRI